MGDYNDSGNDASEDGSDESSGSGERWDPEMLENMECKQVFIGERYEADNDERLPEFFDTNIIKKNS